ncbi:MAG TPA: ABC transporter ATP-binding protein [Thermoplasmata archaeon]|nr:ABC transporter ATP-binding protein [Thermoplasmata archaeon]
MTEPVLRVDHLSVDYVVGAGTFQAVTDVSFELQPGRVVGIVGETGCGKSTLGHSIPRLLPTPPARIRSGHIWFRGMDLLALPKWRMPSLRGTGIGMIFQEPINSLNPAYRVQDQMLESLRIRRFRDAGVASVPAPRLQPFDYSRPGGTKPTPSPAQPFVGALPEAMRGGRPIAKELRKEVLDFLRLVRINDPERILNLYPHELSGGMRQRVMIAMALSEKPSLLIADEPTSALDVTIQAQVLTLMKELMGEVETSILFISHDLGVIAEMADEVGVMYAGHLAEFGPVQEIFEAPQHPYTKALIRSVPNQYKDQGPLPSLPGSVPNLSQLPPGCAFHPRCPLAQPVCRDDPGPGLSANTAGTHPAACYFSTEVAGLP